MKKMQSEAADFPPVPPPAELDETCASTLILAHSLYYYENMTSSTKPEVHNVLHCCQKRTDSRQEVIMYIEFVDSWTVIFYICERTDRQTDNSQTDRETR